MRDFRFTQWMILAALASFVAGCGEAPSSLAPESRVIVIGFDGMDPALTEQWMAEGQLPNFAALAQEGHYQRLETSNPPQSPVAWASFATGLDAGGHGIFDFLRRDPETYSPDFSIARHVPPTNVVDVFGWQIPFDEGQVLNQRDGQPFWLELEQHGHHASVLRVPVTYPPDAITRMLSGMGVPDLLGSQGTYTLFATRRVAGADNGGRVELVGLDDDGIMRAELNGPAHPLKPDAPSLSIPLVLTPRDGGAQLTLGSHVTDLETGKWSGWIRVRFPFAGITGVDGMVRANLQEGFPRPILYLSPIQVDPRSPAIPISMPVDYATELAAAIGDYHTLGMPEETWALNQGHLSESAWLDVVRTTFAEGEAMLDDTLKRNDSALIVKVFVQTDRVSHMFWRGIDERHPLHEKADAQARNAIKWVYGEADRILGDVRAKLRSTDRLVVLSDHGFSGFRRAVHLNRWLVDNGYMALRADANPDSPLFAAVDWTRTRAYALGLNGLFVNRKNRESHGIVEDAEYAELLAELQARLLEMRDFELDDRVIRSVRTASELYHGSHAAEAPDLVVGYAPGYRASWQTSLGAIPDQPVEDNLQPWSGDHCIDPDAVPGILFTSFKLDTPIQSIRNLGELTIQILGKREPQSP